jgi:hypothetical protein
MLAFHKRGDGVGESCAAGLQFAEALAGYALQ